MRAKTKILKQVKKQTKYSDQLFSDIGAQVAQDNDSRMETSEVSPMIAPACCLERLSRPWHRDTEYRWSTAISLCRGMGLGSQGHSCT